MSTRDDLSDEELVEAFLDATRELSYREVEEATGVSYGNIGRYRKGEWKRLYPATRRVMLEYLRRVTESEQPQTEPEPSEAEEAASDILANFDSAARFLNGMGAPGQATARKLAAIELYERTAAAWGFRMPDWWYTLADQVRRGEL